MPTNSRRFPHETTGERLLSGDTLPETKHNLRFLSLLLQALIMVLVISLFFIFVGVAAIIFIHLCIVGGALHRRRNRRHQQQRRRPVVDDDSSKMLIKTLPKSRFRGSEICPICLENLYEGEICRVLPDCKHVFHLNCVDRWISKVPACPVCRSPLFRRNELEPKRSAGIDWEQLWAG